MKQTLPLILLTAAFISAHGQTAYLSEDFESGIPAAFATYDLDGNEHSTEMKDLGFDIGKAWITVKTDKETNSAACSTSWYRKAGTSNDWLVTPAIEIAEEGAVIRWRAMASDKEYRDGYKVLISTKGNKTEDFTEKALLTVKAEKNEWTSHEIKLDKYAGQKIWIAFVNDTKDKTCLYVDDIFVGVPSHLEVSSNIARVIARDGKVTIDALITNTSKAAVEGFTFKYSFNGGEEITREFPTRKVAAGKSVSVNFESDFEMERFETATYHFAVITGDDSSECDGIVSVYPRKVVAEEVTGTWCGYCVRGIYTMNFMKENYGENFLGIAVHDSSKNWEDPMAYPDYTQWLFSAFAMKGYPHCTVNRSVMTTGDPGNLGTYYLSHIEKPYTMGIQLKAKGDIDTGKIEAETNVFSATEATGTDYRLAYVLIENDVHNGETIYDEQGKPQRYNGWEQNNYYAGGALGDLGGFEKLPETINGRDMWYQDVARFISEPYTGIEDVIPADFGEGNVANHTYTLTMPESVREQPNTELAVLLINGKTGEIVNADVVSLRNEFTGICPIEAEAAEVSVMRRGNSIVAAAEAGIQSIAVYAADGAQVAFTAAAAAEAEISVEGLNGFHIVCVTLADGSVKTSKYIF